MSKKGTFYCAGSVITRKHVLTAAHCLQGYVSSNYNRIFNFGIMLQHIYITKIIFRFNIKTIKLVLMDSDRSSVNRNAIVRRIKSATIHENFHSYTFNNDIAIIEMDEPVSVNGIVRTACLPEGSKLLLTSTKYL